LDAVKNREYQEDWLRNGTNVETVFERGTLGTIYGYKAGEGRM
jgi:hypothetical protein